MLRRLGTLAAAALLVSLASAWLAPRTPILFGILHCIVVTNALALPFRRWSVAPLLALSVAALAVPSIWNGLPGTIAWAWIGLSATEPAALDFRPLLPWFGVVLIGLAAGRGLAEVSLGASRHPAAGIAILAVCGRHSLAIYLLHQPVLIALLMLALGHLPQIGAGTVPDDPVQFLHQCSASCVDQGGEAALCRSTCHCVLTATTHPGSLEPAGAPPAGQGSVLDESLRGAIARCWRARKVPP